VLILALIGLAIGLAVGLRQSATTYRPVKYVTPPGRQFVAEASKYNCGLSSLCTNVPATTLDLIRNAFQAPGETEAMLNLSTILSTAEGASFDRTKYEGLFRGLF
jgi:hypothetical protein